MVAHLGADFFDRSVHEVAPALIGCELTYRGVGGPIVEVEAYDQTDAASHSYKGRTDRTDVMFGPAGRVYVYRSYGIHWCMNLVCDREGYGAAVLIRALEPRHGIEQMRERRGGRGDRELAAGPGRLTQALGITSELNGASIGKDLRVTPRTGQEQVAVGVRIGISVAVGQPWRYGRTDSRYLSRPIRPKAP